MPSSRLLLASVAVLAVSTRALFALAASVTASAAAAASASSGSLADAAAIPSESRSVFGWWEILQHGTPEDYLQLLSPRWWVRYILAEFEAEPAHVLLEVACFATILYLLAVRRPAPPPQEKLTKKEEEQLIAEWQPAPLCPEVVPSTRTRFVVESATGRTVQANGRSYLNFASSNFLGLADKEDIKAACRETIEKYGVGSCGPRGFYGTFDVHLEFEKRVASFLGAQECILYSDSLACVSSVIPAFAKKGDIIVVDDATSFGMQQGCLLSRSSIHYFQHGNMKHLEQVLAGIEAKEKAAAKKKGSGGLPTQRKFLVMEGVSSVFGDITPLAHVVALKKQYKYRLILDDSYGFGVLGAKGKGTFEHAGVPIEDVDIMCASIDHSLASVGGFCVGNHQVVDHQRLSGAGYCFSASSPPYTSTASIGALTLLEKQPQLTDALRKKAVKLRRALASVHRKLEVLGSADGHSDVSPCIHLTLTHSVLSHHNTLEDIATLERISELLEKEAGIVACVPEFIPADKALRRASIRILLTVQHTDADCDKLVKAITAACKKVL